MLTSQNITVTETKGTDQDNKHQTIPINAESMSQAEIEEAILTIMAGPNHCTAVEQVFIAAALGPLEHGTEALAVTYWAGRFGSKHRLKWKRQPAFGEIVFEKCEITSDTPNPTSSPKYLDQTEGSVPLGGETSSPSKNVTGLIKNGAILQNVYADIAAEMKNNGYMGTTLEIVADVHQELQAGENHEDTIGREIARQLREWLGPAMRQK